jgi:hypothetical protein
MTDLAHVSPTPESAQHQSAVVALRMFLAAGLHPGFGWDKADAELLWGARLAPYSVAAITTAANDWISRRDIGFPTLAEFEPLAASAPSRHDRPSSGSCPECDGDMWVYLDNPPPGDIPTVRPCSQCRPDAHGQWQAGKYRPKFAGKPASDTDQPTPVQSNRDWLARIRNDLASEFTDQPSRRRSSTAPEQGDPEQ